MEFGWGIPKIALLQLSHQVHLPIIGHQRRRELFSNGFIRLGIYHVPMFPDYVRRSRHVY
jgi:hypothetical protein